MNYTLTLINTLSHAFLLLCLPNSSFKPCVPDLYLYPGWSWCIQCVDSTYIHVHGHKCVNVLQEMAYLPHACSYVALHPQEWNIPHPHNGYLFFQLSILSFKLLMQSLSMMHNLQNTTSSHSLPHTYTILWKHCHSLLSHINPILTKVHELGRLRRWRERETDRQTDRLTDWLTWGKRTQTAMSQSSTITTRNFSVIEDGGWTVLVPRLLQKSL